MIGNDPLLMKKLVAYRRDWPWAAMRGSRDCLKWGFRDLRNLEQALEVTPGRECVVQAGGNLGLFPKRLAEDFRTVITFEPDPKLFERMVRNAYERNITAIQAALGNSNDPVGLSRRRRDNTGKPEHEGLTHVAGPGEIPQVRLDDMNLAVCDLLYLDIEGYELNALRGAEQTIRRCRPVIGVEVNRNISFAGSSPEELREWILGCGYRFSFRAWSDEVFVPEER